MHKSPEDDLPPAGLKKWSAQRKAQVVIAVRSEILSRSEAFHRYLLSEEELWQWEEAFSRDGIAGLLLKKRSLLRKHK